MRNVFDQYTQPENRLTHALASSLAADPRLVRKFVRWATGERVDKGRRLEILEQQLPGEEDAIDEAQAERRGFPDAWIYDRNGWALVIESKIESPLTRDQLERHRRVAERRGFSDAHLLALVTELPRPSVPRNVTIRTWTQLYSWVLHERQSEWTRRLTSYMEVLESRLVAEAYLKEGTLTVFAGIPFGRDCPYNYLEAKRLLRLAMDQLRRRGDLKREIDMDPEGRGRPAITGREGGSSWGVWDFLPLRQARNETSFTKCPHLTLSIQHDRIFACVTLPNDLKTEYRESLLRGGKEHFFDLFGDLRATLEGLLRNVKGAAPWIEIVQRRYPTQRSVPMIDAKLELDLRTATLGSARLARIGRAVKSQPEWMDAAYQAFAKKRSNLQMTVGVIFPYDRCVQVRSREILDYIAKTWLACGPLVRALVG